MRAHTIIALARPCGRKDDRFYFRVGNNDHVVLNRLIAERRLQTVGWSWTPVDMIVTRLFDVMREKRTFRPAWTLRRQYTELSRIPVSMRAEYFIHNVFSPVCDMLTRASDIHDLFKKTQRRVLSVKAVLLDLLRERVRIQEGLRVPGNDSSRPPTARIIPLTPREPRGR